MRKDYDLFEQVDASDEDLIDTLIAISVVSKRLACNLKNKHEENNMFEEHVTDSFFTLP